MTIILLLNGCLMIVKKNIQFNIVKGARLKKCLVGVLFMYGVDVYAETNFASVTLDNDVFVGKDNGYTNGLYFSLYNVGAGLRPNFWVSPLLWTMPRGYAENRINVHSIGQTLTTAEDITQANPPEGSLPYSGLLKYTNTHIVVGPRFADWASTSVGIVGPAAKGKQTQTEFHALIGAEKPMGWDTQLKNEFVFGFSRGRAIRVLASRSDTMDLLAGGQVSLGTISSGVNAGMMLRIGQNLRDSYSTVSLASSRASNPIAVNNSWFVYAGVSANYVFNQIFTDGNTFRDSRSIDYDHNYNTFMTGITYTIGRNSSLSFAYFSSFSDDDTEYSRQTERLNRFGTLTLAWAF